MLGIQRIGRILLFSVTLTAACAGKTEAPAESWPDKIKVEVRKVEEGESGGPELQIKLRSVEGWSLNTAYPGVKVELAEETPAKTKLLKKDAGKFDGVKPGDKAARLIFHTPLTSEKGELPTKVEGSYKAVVCTKVTCSPPFTGTFSETPGDSAVESAGGRD